MNSILRRFDTGSVNDARLGDVGSGGRGMKEMEGHVNPVIQEERTGCGIASVATGVGVCYRLVQRVAHRLGMFSEDPRLWSQTGYVRRLLRHFSIRVAGVEVRFVSWQTLPHLALLAIKWHTVHGCESWHWVVFWRGAKGAVELDPNPSLQSHRRRDFGRMHPRWFIPLTKTARSPETTCVGARRVGKRTQ